VDQWYQSGLLLVVLNACPQQGQGTKNWVLRFFLLRKKSLALPKQPLMVGEKKYDGTGDPFKMFLEESLMQQRNEMMDSFAQILQRLPT
jgi:hypothetical protein